MGDKTVLVQAGLARHAPERIAHGHRFRSACRFRHARTAAARDMCASRRDRTPAATTLP